VLVEPIQGEAGVVIPPEGYLRRIREICDEKNRPVHRRRDPGGARPRRRDASPCDREGVVPDLYLLGKALGGGILPVSAVVGNTDVLGVIRPGEHGSTFGGNPLAAAVGLRVVEMLQTGEFQERARALGAHLEQGPAAADRHTASPPSASPDSGPASTSTPPGAPAVEIAEKLLERGRPRQGHARPDRAHRAAARDPRDRARLGGGAAQARARLILPRRSNPLLRAPRRVRAAGGVLRSTGWSGCRENGRMSVQDAACRPASVHPSDKWHV
jgi:hypothetical protein